jgi:hypothetical protein
MLLQGHKTFSTPKMFSWSMENNFHLIKFFNHPKHLKMRKKTSFEKFFTPKILKWSQALKYEENVFR